MPKTGVVDFSTQEILGMLEGRKTVFRRYMRAQPADSYRPNRQWITGIVSPFGKKGDVVPVREAFHLCEYRQDRAIFYKKDALDGASPDCGSGACGWTVSTLLPIEHVRFYIKIMNLRIDRIQNITEQDAIDEGFTSSAQRSAVEAYRAYWMGISRNKKIGRQWEDNPWVWVVRFRWLRKGRPMQA
jgi:hypothetical protein